LIDERLYECGRFAATHSSGDLYVAKQAEFVEDYVTILGVKQLICVVGKGVHLPGLLSVSGPARADVNLVLPPQIGLWRIRRQNDLLGAWVAPKVDALVYEPKRDEKDGSKVGS